MIRVTLRWKLPGKEATEETYHAAQSYKDETSVRAALIDWFDHLGVVEARVVYSDSWGNLIAAETLKRDGMQLIRVAS